MRIILSKILRKIFGKGIGIYIMMKPRKNTIIFVLITVLLVLCGILPMIIAKIQDYAADEKVVYEDRKTIQLFRELNDTEKLYLLKSGSKIEIGKERTKLKSENMQEVVITAISNLEPFVHGNLSDFSIECEPFLYYSNQFPELSDIFWHVKMELSDELGQSIYLCLDDSTDKLLSISYECLEPVYMSKKLDYYLGTLFLNYLSQMDYWLAMQSASNIEGMEVNEEVTNAKKLNFSMGDIIYGEFHIYCIMTETGFQIDVE